MSASKIKNKEENPEFQIVISFCKPEIAQKIYKERWQIETAFRAMKTSGFNLEYTHLTDIERIEKLVALVTIAFCWVYLVGIYLHENHKPIRMLNNGKKAKKLFQIWADIYSFNIFKRSISIKYRYFQIFVMYLARVVLFFLKCHACGKHSSYLPLRH